MKQCIITVCLIFMVIMVSSGQSPQSIKNLRMAEISERFVLQKKNPARMELYRFFSEYFTDNNIYPNPDAIDLIDAYNKQTGMEEIKLNRFKFKAIKFPVVSNELKTKINEHRALVIKTNVMLNNSFKSAVKTFNRMRWMVNALYKIPRTFKDSLATFGKQILPGINNYSENISALQMEFFLISLQDINKLMEQLPRSTNTTLALQAISEMMDDFFEFNIGSTKGIIRRDTNGFIPDNKKSAFYFAGYDPGMADKTSHDEDEPELPNANVYVYTKGAEGKWSQEPKPYSFNVYYGANGLKYSLTPGCDTLSFFKYHPSVPASTLPVFLAKGNYCFVLQDVTNKRLYLRPGINLRDNKVIDDMKLIKLCFIVEN